MKKILKSVMLSTLAVGLFFVMTSVAMAAASATGGTSSTTVNGTQAFVTMSDLVITCGAPDDITAAGDIVLTLSSPAGATLNFDTATNVNVAVTGTITVASGTVTPTATSITVDVTTNCAASDTVTISTIKVKATDYGTADAGSTGQILGAVAVGDGNGQTFPVDNKKPTLSAVTTQDLDNDGSTDAADLVFSENMDDSTDTTASHWEIGDVDAATIQTATCDDTTDIDADDEKLCVKHADGTEASGTELKTVDYDTGGLKDLAGNGFDIGNDLGTTKTDGAQPVILSIVFSQDGTTGRNKAVFSFSEAMYIDNTDQDGNIGTGDTTSGGSIASATNFGNIDTAGSIEGLGNFATAGNVDESGDAVDYWTVAADGKSMTWELAYATNSYLANASTTAPSGAFTPDDAAFFLAQTPAGTLATQKINTSATPSPSGSWDLTKPTISSAVLTDAYINANTSAAGNDGKVDKITLTASETLKTVASSSDTINDWTLTSGVTEFGNNLSVMSASASGTDYTILFSGANVFYDTAAFTVQAASDEWSLMDLAGNILPPTSKVCMSGYICTGGTANYAVTTLSIEKPGTTDTVKPGKPTSIEAVQTEDGAVKLTWNDPTDSDLSKIVIMRGKNGATITGTAYATVSKGAETYTDTDVAIGDTVEYLLKAVDAVGNASLLPDIVSITLEEQVAEEEAVEETTEEEEVAAEEEAAAEEEESAETPEEEVAPAEAGEEEAAPAPGTGVTAEQIVEVFEDVQEVEWVAEAVAVLYDEGVVEGKQEGEFAPADNLNRAEAAAMLYRVLGMDEPSAPDEDPFGDVDKDAWYAGYVAELKGLEIVKGNPDGTYEPGEEINRAEFLTLVMRVYENLANAEELAALEELSGTTTHYADLADSWYTATVAKATQLGFVEGSLVGGEYYFKAETTINRAEASQMIYNAFYVTD